MYVKQVLPLFVCAIVLGWLMPAEAPFGETGADGKNGDRQFIATGRSDSFPSGGEDDIEQLIPDQIVLSREGDGHFYADIEVNHASLRFLVDTGATTVALTGEDARAIGLIWTEDELQPIARGASGPVYGKQVVIERMQVGNVQANNVPAAIVPKGLDVSLLGQTFLARIGSVNIRDNKMIWN